MQVENLENNIIYNNKRGVVVTDIVDGRYGVLVFTDDAEKRLKIKIQNLVSRVDNFLVVETQYPTQYGCHSGQSFSQEYIWRNSSVGVSGPYATRAEADRIAENIRDSSEFFDDWASCSAELFADGPPFDSALRENYDNDEELMIQVLSEDVYDEDRFEKKRIIDETIKRHEKKRIAEASKKAAKIAKKGRVHYSFPAKDYDIKAELEVHFEHTKPLEDYTNLSTIKSILFRECNGMREGGLDRESSFQFMLGMINLSTSLEELHWHNAHCNDEKLKALLDAAPHLSNTLKVFSIPHARELTPSAVEMLSFFESLEVIVLDGSFSTGYYDFDLNSGPCFSEIYPFDGPLDRVFNCLPKLKEFSVNHYDQESKVYFYKYCCSHEAMDSFRAEFPKVAILEELKQHNL